MRVGVCTTDYAARPARELFDTIAEAGYDFVQFAFASITESNYEPTGMIEIPPEIPDSLIDIIKNESQRTNLPVEVVNGTYNMAHPDIEVRLEGLRRMKLLIDASQKLGAKYITICTGTRDPEFLWRRHELNSTDEAYGDMLHDLKILAEYALERNVALLIETEASNTVFTPEIAKKTIELIGLSSVKIVLDPANLFQEGMAHKDMAKSVVSSAIDMLNNYIVLAHGKDIKEGDGIEFCGTGDGIIDFADMLSCLKKINFTGDMALHGIYDESKMRPALEYMRRTIAPLFDSKVAN